VFILYQNIFKIVRLCLLIVLFCQDVLYFFALDVSSMQTTLYVIGI